MVKAEIYLCTIEDECSNRIVGNSASDRLQASLAVEGPAISCARPGR